jgi:chorismate-pyruvate lyase
MRIDLTGLPEKARTQIETHAAPLGRVMIRNNLLREVELLALWRVQPAAPLRELLGLSEGEEIYGRSARILVDGRPAVELLEIVKA